MRSWPSAARRLVSGGLALLALPLLVGAAAGLVPFDFQVTTDLYVIRFPPAEAFVLLGSALALLGVLRRNG